MRKAYNKQDNEMLKVIEEKYEAAQHKQKEKQDKTETIIAESQEKNEMEDLM